MTAKNILTKQFSEFSATYIAPYKENKENNGWNRDLIMHDLTQWKNNRFGLFTPYKNPKDFSFSLALPLAIPLVIAIAPIVASVALVTATLSLMVAGVAHLAHRSNIQDSALEFAIFSGLATGIALTIATLAPIIAALTIPPTTLSLITRSGSTLASKASQIITNHQHGDEENYSPVMEC